MQLQGKALRVIIYIGESDHYQGKALYMALLQLLKQEGASGATVVRGLAGFGARSRIHTASIVDLSTDLPIRVEWIDQQEVVERLLPQVRQMIDDGLITVDEVNVIQYAPGRRPDPLTHPVQDVMRREVLSVSPETPVAEIVTLLLQKGYRSLPVVDAEGRPLGMITDGDLLRRAGLVTRLGLQGELAEDHIQRQLTDLRRRQEKATDLMSKPAITVAQHSTLQQAMTQMIDHHLKRLPVVNEAGRLTGWISRVDILRTIEYHDPVPETKSEGYSAGGTIIDLMYRDMPTVRPQAKLEEILQALEQNRRRRVIVVDDDRHVVGIITDGDLLRRAPQGAQPGLVDRLRRLMTGRSQPEDAPLLDATETAEDLMSRPVVTINQDDNPNDALRLMLQHGIKRLPVVDDQGRLIGLLGRSSLLSGLLSDERGDVNA